MKLRYVKVKFLKIVYRVAEEVIIAKNNVIKIQNSKPLFQHDQESMQKMYLNIELAYYLLSII